jgi:hypothetical protein
MYGATISTPYLDASGAGEVVTISRVITRGGGPNDPVAGVVGTDFKLNEIERLVNLQAPCAESNVRCMLLDETAHVVYHQDFVSTQTADENVFLAAKHREVAKTLVAQGILKQNTCMDYASGYRKTSYSFDLSGTEKGSLSCGMWSLARAGKTNMYLLMLSSNGCISNYAKRTQTCTPCSEANCASSKWATLSSSLLCQPCQCKVEYDSCALNYAGAHPAPPASKNDACPASPPPLFSDLCPNDGHRSGKEKTDVGGIIGGIAAGLIGLLGCYVVIKRCCCTKNSNTKHREPVMPAAVAAPPQRASRLMQVQMQQPQVVVPPQQVIQYGQPQQVVPMAIPHNPTMQVAQPVKMAQPQMVAPPSYHA